MGVVKSYQEMDYSAILRNALTRILNLSILAKQDMVNYKHLRFFLKHAFSSTLKDSLNPNKHI